MKLNSVDLNKISIFCQVIDSGNYQRAAEALFVTPSALSQSITSLEASLGFPLFHRQGRKLVPTKDGLRLHHEFVHAQRGFLRSLKELQGKRTEVHGTLRVGAYLEFAKSKLSVILKNFIQEFPEANVKMVFDSPSRLHSLLGKGQLDLCLSIFPSAEKKTIRSRVLCEEELVLIASPSVLPDSPSLEQILRTPIIDYYFNHQPISRWLSLHFQRRPKKIPVRIYASTAEMVASLVREGAGIGVVPEYLVATTEAQKGLRIIRPGAKKLKDYIWLLESVASEKSALHAAFKAKLTARFKP